MSMYSDSGYEVREFMTHSAILDALDTAPDRYKVLDNSGRLLGCDFELAATRLTGRQLWTKALFDQFEALLRSRSAIKLHFVWYCFADTRGIWPPVDRGDDDGGGSAGGYVDPLDFVRVYRTGMNYLDYLAVVEPSIYHVSWSALRKRPELPSHSFMFWHCHGLAWSSDREELAQRFFSLQSRNVFRAVAPGLEACWWRELPHEEIPQKLGYMCKTPRETKRLYFVKKSPRKKKTNFYRQKSSPCRPGEHIRYLDALMDMTLDELAFGGGAGHGLVARARKPFLDGVDGLRWKDVALRLPSSRAQGRERRVPFVGYSRAMREIRQNHEPA